MALASSSFQFPKLPSFGAGRPSIVKSIAPSPTEREVLQTKDLLIDAISNTNNGKSATPEQQLTVVQLVRALETLAPASQELFTDKEEAQKIDGVWYLQWTSPSVVEEDDGQADDAWKPENAEEGESRINTRRFEAKGSVEAAGVRVDTSNRVVQQIINVSDSTVTNQVDLGWGLVQAGGGFRPSETVPIRAIVSFNRADITLESGFVIRLGWWFDILPLFKGGSRDNGWLETTFVDEEIRIGRGNLGTLFVLTRDPKQVAP